MGPWCQVFGLAMFLCILSCWQELCRLRPCRGKLLFLDRACIHQSNDLLRQRGIEHLAAFLYYSWSLLVCYSDEYLQKLWTVYEVSSFMLLHPGSAIHVSHPWYAKFLIFGMMVVCIQEALEALLLDEFLHEDEDPTEMSSILVRSVCQIPTSV